MRHRRSLPYARTISWAFWLLVAAVALTCISGLVAVALAVWRLL